MRCTQIIGLTVQADEFLEKEVKRTPKIPCPTCKHVTGGDWYQVVYDETTGVQAGMFDDGPLLHEYTLKNGETVREVIQASPWSSGPCIFLCLEDKDGKRMFEWSEKEINNA